MISYFVDTLCCFSNPLLCREYSSEWKRRSCSYNARVINDNSSAEQIYCLLSDSIISGNSNLPENRPIAVYVP